MRVVFMGTPDFAVPTLKAVDMSHDLVGVITQPDRKSGRGQKLTMSPVKRYALENRIPLFQPENVNESEVADNIRALKPDALVVIAYGQILKKSLLTLAPLGAINVHASLLPHLRGGAPIHWSIIRSFKETGITTMKMSRGLDAGDILLQEKTPIYPNETVGELHDRLCQIGASLLIETLKGLDEGNISPVAQDHSKATYAPNLTKDDRVIQWNRTAQTVHDLVRGLNPWPGAYTTLSGKQVKILRTEVITALECGDPPGTIVALDDTITVACGTGYVRVVTIQPQNRTAMSAGDFIRGYKCGLEDIFGI